jgi:TatD DNase family protein
MLIDSHCHLDRLDLTNYNDDLSLALLAAEKVNVKYFLCAGIDLENSRKILEIAKKYKNIVTSVGLHPTEESEKKPSVEELISLAADQLVVAIGETGLDYYRCEHDKMAQVYQQDLFRDHIRAANTIKKPLIIHSRMAKENLFEILRDENAANVGGVFHCFTEDWQVAKMALDMNFYISFSGIITFKNADALREVAKKIPADKILIETDAPYLAPTPFRGKQNEPAFLPYIAEKLAAIRGESVTQIAKQTSQNFFSLFKIKNP